MSDDEDDTPYTFRRFWWDLTHLFTSVADIVEEEKRKIDTILWNINYDIKTAERESEWVYEAARISQRTSNTEGARQHLLSYAQKQVSLRRMREHAGRLDQHKASLTGINIQFHMTNSHEHLAWAVESWSKTNNVDKRLENLDKLAESLGDMASLVNEGDTVLEQHNVTMENTQPMVQSSHNIDTTVAGLLKQLQDEHLKEAPRPTNRKPFVKKPLSVKQ